MIERGGGILLACGLVVGAIIGIAVGNGAVGMAVGLVVGAAGAWALARHEARRRK